MKKIRLLTLLLLGLFAGGTAYAQDRVSGVVKSSEDGQPLAGVVVQIKGTTIGALTVSDGTYTITNASVGNSTLVFSYAGMRKQEVAVAGKSAINVTMHPDALQAEAVVVTAMGGRKQERALGYSTTTVTGDDLARTNTISPLNALQGKVAGLNIGTTNAAGLTGDPMVTLRGAKSLGKNNSPIYVIDGIVMENTVTGAWDNKGNMYGNQLKNLNPADFESVTVLKGAAATSLYGSRGGNGAIVITSKSGTSRKGIGVEVNYTREFSSTYAAPFALQNEYGMGDPRNGFEGGVDPTTQTSVSGAYMSWNFGPRLDQGIEMRQRYKLWQNREGYEYDPIEPMVSYPDNWKSLFDNGHQDNVSVALTGGTDKTTYRLSYAFTDVKGALPNNEFNKHVVNFRTNGQLNDIFAVNFSLLYSNTNTLNAHGGGIWDIGFSELVTNQLSRNTDLAWYKDNYINPETWERMGTDDASGLVNLRNALNRTEDNNLIHNEQTIIANVGITAQLTDWLDASTTLSYNHFSYSDETKNWGSEIYRTGGSNYYSAKGGSSGSYDGMAQIHSNNRFLDDNLGVDVRLFGQLYGTQFGNYYSKETRGGLKVPGVWSFSNSMEPILVGNVGADYNRRNNMTVGIGASVNLDWKDQLFLEVSARNDWLSTLLYPSWLPQGGDNYSVFYPSVNLSWIFSDTFNIDSDILSYGQLRASFAQVGSGTSPYETAKGAGGFVVETFEPVAGDALFTAYKNDGTLPNYDLKPEIQSTIEFGTDLRFLNGAIGIDLAYYKINTKNQILTLPAVGESGVGKQLINAGNIQNQGWELALDFVPIRTRTVNWNIGLIWSRNRSKIIELHPNIDKQELASGSHRGMPAIYAFEGGAFGEIVAGYYGADETHGKYYDFNDPNNPLNGKNALVYNPSYLGSTATKYQTTNYMYSPTLDKDGNKQNYWNEDNKYDVVGNVEADFYATFTTNLTVNLPNSSGSLDFFAQIDGRVGGDMITPNHVFASQLGATESTLYGRSEEHGGVARVNWKGDTEYNGIIMDGVYDGRTQQLAKTMNGSGNLGANGEAGTGYVDLRGYTNQQAVDNNWIAPTLAGVHYIYNYNVYGRSPVEMQVQELTYFSLREITVGYNMPEKWIKYVGLQSARLSFSARNLCYLYNSLPDNANPESMSSNNPLTPQDFGGTPFTRNFSFNVNLRF